MHVSPLQRDFDAIFKHILVTYYLRLPTYLPTYLPTTTETTKIVFLIYLHKQLLQYF